MFQLHTTPSRLAAAAWRCMHCIVCCRKRMLVVHIPNYHPSLARYAHQNHWQEHHHLGQSTHLLMPQRCHLSKAYCKTCAAGTAGTLPVNNITSARTYHLPSDCSSQQAAIPPASAPSPRSEGRPSAHLNSLASTNCTAARAIDWNPTPHCVAATTETNHRFRRHTSPLQA